MKLSNLFIKHDFKQELEWHSRWEKLIKIFFNLLILKI
jgi:hypothetical protein